MVYYYNNGEKVIESRTKPDTADYIEKEKAIPIPVKKGYVAKLRILNDEIFYELIETKEHIIETQIFQLKQNLSDTDYKAIKYAEGLLTEEEYAETKADRQAWRDRINELEEGA